MADDLTLDIPDPQVVVHFPGDPQFTYHHRLLLVKLGPGRWIASSPDHELAVVDLNTIGHRILGRRAPFPGDIAQNIYAFDHLGRGDLERLRRQARTMALILGDDDVEEVEARVWVFSDHKSERLGKPVELERLGDAVTLGERGLLEVDGDVEGITEIDASEIHEFADKVKGSHGDLRVLGLHYNSETKRFLSFKDAYPLFKESAFDDWVFSGPRAVREFLQSIFESGTDLGGYHLQWVKNSNVNQHSSVCHEHRNLMEVLRLAITRDQIDPTCLMSMELLVRRAIQLEMAVSRNSNSPDYSGLDVLLENPLTESGSASTRRLDEWVTSRLKERAQIAKNSRLFKEEVSHAAKGRPSKRGDAEGVDFESNWRRKKKAKAKAGAGAGGAGASES